MSLAINNNVASMTAQHNLQRTSSALARSLERLSSGMKINRGADGPAALVISEHHRAQIAGLQAAIENSEKAVSMVQTTEGALSEMNSLLVKIRSLVVDSANEGVNDTNSLAANQAEITNALDTIDRIATNTQFGTKKLLDGSASTADGGADLVFQIGPNASQTASIAVSKSNPDSIGVVAGNQFASLADIDVTAAGAATDALAVVDQAIDDVTNLRGDLGAFQVNTLESTANNLRATLENTVNAESVIRDTDFAMETANFTKNQVLVQAGTTVLSNANQVPQLVLALLGR